ncbi:MAG: hypothetical protein GY810_19130 [Aureispira sp.]|nr:hypothetical protein [Aureispira sp.]
MIYANTIANTYIEFALLGLNLLFIILLGFKILWAWWIRLVPIVLPFILEPTGYLYSWSAVQISFLIVTLYGAARWWAKQQDESYKNRNEDVLDEQLLHENGRINTTQAKYYAWILFAILLLWVGFIEAFEWEVNLSFVWLNLSISTSLVACFLLAHYRSVGWFLLFLSSLLNTVLFINLDDITMYYYIIIALASFIFWIYWLQQNATKSLATT